MSPAESCLAAGGRAAQPGGRARAGRKRRRKEEEEEGCGGRGCGLPFVAWGCPAGAEGRGAAGAADRRRAVASRCPMSATAAALAEGAALAAGAAVPYAVELGLTVLHTALYAALFLFAYLQLWLLLYYRERRLSYHTLCLFLCLLWAALRTTLFSFYLQNSLQALRLQQPFAHWLLYCLPGCLLFASLCLLNLYFAEVSRGLVPLAGGDTKPPPPCRTPRLKAALQPPHPPTPQTWRVPEGRALGWDGGVPRAGSQSAALRLGAGAGWGELEGCALNPGLGRGAGIMP